jgi:hypothetical protein
MRTCPVASWPVLQLKIYATSDLGSSYDICSVEANSQLVSTDLFYLPDVPDKFLVWRKYRRWTVCPKENAYIPQLDLVRFAVLNGANTEVGLLAVVIGLFLFYHFCMKSFAFFSLSFTPFLFCYLLLGSFLVFVFVPFLSRLLFWKAQSSLICSTSLHLQHVLSAIIPNLDRLPVCLWRQDDLRTGRDGRSRCPLYLFSLSNWDALTIPKGCCCGPWLSRSSVAFP